MINYFPLFAKCLTILLLICTFSSCTPESEPNEPPNIVWITSEDNSKHYLKLFDENGVRTPNIESLAANGVTFNHAFSNAPVCSVARSALISGCYGPRTGTQFHRKIVKVPMPSSLTMFPAYLSQAGYYTTNKSKEDYNFTKGEGVWDESSKDASWRNRQPGQPFFHVSNIGISHESGLHFTEAEMNSTPTSTDLNSFSIQPNHPQTDLFRYTNAYYRDKIVEMDGQVGEVVAQLEQDGLLDDTFIFYFGDHGGVLPGSKGYLYETGLHVPLVVYVPPKYKHLVDLPPGSKINGFVGFIDFAPTVLNLAGVNWPNEMDGTPFLGENVNPTELSVRDEIYSYADRFDEKYDMVRALRKGKFKYIRNYQPFNFDGLMNNYRYIQLAYEEWQSMYENGGLNQMQAGFYEPKAPEMLFNIETDPFETINLATEPGYAETLKDMREKLSHWVKQMPDLSFFPEHHLISNAFDNPVDFGKRHKQKIESYINTSNLCLSEFSDVKTRLIQSLESSDPWIRYWGLISCSSFLDEAKELVPLITSIMDTDPELINKVRAAEYLGLTRVKDPSEVMTRSLYQSQDPAEALLILNSIALMASHRYHYSFDIQLNSLSKIVRENDEVKRRLRYLIPVRNPEISSTPDTASAQADPPH